VAAVALALESLTAGTVQRLRDSGVEPILLRGPVLGRWLYDDELERPYRDVDLLVSPAQIATATAVINDLGFARAPHVPTHPVDHASTFVRQGDRAMIDLHETLVGIDAAPEVVWQTLSAETERMRIGSTDIAVLGLAARIVMVALHSASHGIKTEKPMVDLRRAVAKLDDDIWADAVKIAEKLDATEAFVAGLSLDPEGSVYVARLPPVRMSIKTALRARTPPPTAPGLVRFWEARGPRARMRFVARELFPEAEFMRAWSPLARRGSLGLVASYVWRIPWLVVHAAAAAVLLLRIAREVARRNNTQEAGPRGDA
jgi:hypothetical protein